MIEPEYKFREKYRVPSNRLQNHDYSSDGAYFITICTKNRENYFGEIKDGVMVMNDVGEIAEKFLQEIPDHFQNVSIDTFIIMPNHVHMVVMIESGQSVEMGCPVNMGCPVETRQCLVSTSGSKSESNDSSPNRFQNQ